MPRVVESLFAHGHTPTQVLKTLVKMKFASKVILFQEMFEFKNIIAYCYG
jgi:hypothetical protein